MAATPEEHARRLGDALATLDDHALRAGLASMSDRSRGDLAGQLNLPRAAVFLGDALPPVFRRKLLVAPAERQLVAAFALSEACNDDTVAALGDRSENPTRDDMVEVLPAIIDRHGTALVSLMLASYAASDAPCQAVCSELLDTDERFAIAPSAETARNAAPAVARGPSLTPEQEAALAAKRDERKAAKAAKRAAEERRRLASLNAQAKRKQAQHEAKRRG